MDVAQPDRYVMGRTAAERGRLSLQDRLYGVHSTHLARLAGIGPGLRVLDVGCGAGTTTGMLAQLVGPGGEVIGVDQDPDSLDLARQAAAEQEWSHVSYRQADLAELTLDEPVDAVFGRLILMHLDDPAGTITALARLVRPGGLVTFHEINTTAARSVPEVAAWTSLRTWIITGFRHGGREPDLGDQLPAIFQAAGLPTPQLAGFQVAGGADSLLPEFGTSTVASVAALTVAAGTATEAEIRALTADEVAAQTRARDAVLFSPQVVAAWATVPG